MIKKYVIGGGGEKRAVLDPPYPTITPDSITGEVRPGQLCERGGKEQTYRQVERRTDIQKEREIDRVTNRALVNEYGN